jgi:hypothetical protein
VRVICTALAFAFALGAALAPSASAQQVLVDRGARVEGLWCFPSALDEKQWYYVPLSAQLASDEQGQPIFSYLRYVVNRLAEDGGASGITEADGGAVLNFFIEYDTPAETVRRAERALRSRLSDDQVALRGPVTFKAGRWLLVSSIVRATGEGGKQVLATGNAPVFEGNRVALSFDLPPERSKLLLESFKMATPDVSLVFEMTLRGLSDSYDAEVTVDWSEVEKSESFGGGVTAFSLVSADVEKGLEELERKGAIRTVVRGESPNMQALLDKAHERLIDLMFTKVEPESAVPPEQAAQQPGLVESLLGPISQMLSEPGALTRAISPIGISVQYKKNELRTSGTTTLHLNAQTPVERMMMMTANLGDLYRRFGEDSAYFRTVNLSDPAFVQREIRVAIDGAIVPEFERMVNGVTVTLRKRHESGAQTLQEVVLDRTTFDQGKRTYQLIYGWDGDADRDRWLQYEYRTRWSLKDGGTVETDWARSERPSIDLHVPYRRFAIGLLGEAQALRDAGVRAIDVTVSYDFFGSRRSEQLALPTHEAFDGKELEITLPQSTTQYDYEIRWLRRGKPPLEASGREDQPFLVVDDLPEEAVAS